MKALLMPLMMSFGLLAAAGSHAQAPAAAPAGTTGVCKDGSYTSTANKRGACRGHQGVKDWYGAAAASGAAAPAASDDTATKKSRKSKADSDTAAAAAPAAAPAGSTGLCKDGSYTSTDTKKGACRGHKGVKEWYGATAAAAAPAPAPAPAPRSTAPAATAPAAMPAPAPAPTAAPTRSAAPAPTASPETRAAAPGGGAGKVWVNTESKVYHCANDRYYGKTKQGEYMSEADALAKGNHASHGKSCSQ
jgi:hypothetical protein